MYHEHNDWIKNETPNLDKGLEFLKRIVDGYG